MYRLLTDEEIIKIKKESTNTRDFSPWSESKAFARNIEQEVMKRMMLVWLQTLKEGLSNAK